MSHESARENTPTKLLTDLRFAALPDRGISAETCRLWGYGLARYKDRTVQVATYRDADGQPCGQKLRFPDKEFSTLGNMSAARLYGEHLWPDGGRMVVVTEGEIDALAASQIQGNKWATVSVPAGAASAKSAIKRSLEWLSRFERVVLAFDMDEPGQKAALECAAILPPGQAFIANLPRKDAADCLRDGLGDALKSAFWNARAWRPDGILTASEAWDRACQASTAPSFPWGLPILDRRTEGLRQGELVVVTGGTGSGKTTLVQQLLVDNLSAGVKAGLVSLEAPLRRVVLDLCSVSRRVQRQEEFNEENRAAWDALSGGLSLYQHFGSTESDNVLSRMRYMARSLECRLLILDHLSIVVSGFAAAQDERRTLDQVMTRLATLAQETESCIVVVSHLRRPDGDAHEEGGRVTLADLRGSGSIAQLAHTVVAVERDQQKMDNHADVRVLKCRHTGDVGPADKITYQRTESRVTPLSQPFA